MDDEIEEDEPLSLGGWVMVYFFWFLPTFAVIIGLFTLYLFAIELSGNYGGLLCGITAVIIAGILTYDGRDENDSPLKHYFFIFLFLYIGIEFILLTFGYSLSPYGPME